MNSVDVSIVDYGMGNLMSVLRAFELIGCEVQVTNNADVLAAANRIVLPGVGAFSVAMENLRKLGLIEVLNHVVLCKKKPFLGVCLGMQLIAEDSFENGHYQGLGWVPATVKRLDGSNGFRVPHMGWNEINPVDRPSSLFEGIMGEATYYFVHSYHVECKDSSYIGSTCNYGQHFVSSIQYENIFATQFHPEKSQKNGIQLLRNFVKYTA